MASDGKKLSMPLILGLILFALVLAGGVAYGVASHFLTADQTSARGPGEFVKLGDAKDGLIVNIGGVNSGRYLKIGIILEMQSGKKEEPSDGKMLSPTEIKVQDIVVQLLRARTIEEFDPAKQDQLKEVIKNELNKVLGDDRIYQVYITHFVLQ